MRLIDADALMEELRDKLGEELGLESQDASGLQLAIDIVEDTIDAEPVRHGTWKKKEAKISANARTAVRLWRQDTTIAPIAARKWTGV